MSGFTFGIGNDDTKDNLLEDKDFFEEDSIKAGEVPEFNEDTTIINENTSTLEENGLLEKEQGELREIRHKPAGSNVNLENLISKIKKHNKVNQSIALEAYDLGFRDELPRVYTYTTQLSDKHLETTLEALERGLVIGVSTEDLDGSVFRNLFGEVYNQVNGLYGTEEEKEEEVSVEGLFDSIKEVFGNLFNQKLKTERYSRWGDSKPVLNFLEKTFLDKEFLNKWVKEPGELEVNKKILKVFEYTGKRLSHEEALKVARTDLINAFDKSNVLGWVDQVEKDIKKIDSFYVSGKTTTDEMTVLLKKLIKSNPPPVITSVSKKYPTTKTPFVGKATVQTLSKEDINRVSSLVYSTIKELDKKFDFEFYEINAKLINDFDRHEWLNDKTPIYDGSFFLEGGGGTEHYFGYGGIINEITDLIQDYFDLVEEVINSSMKLCALSLKNCPKTPSFREGVLF